jgi:hypothetical protein
MLFAYERPLCAPEAVTPLESAFTLAVQNLKNRKTTRSAVEYWLSHKYLHHICADLSINSTEHSSEGVLPVGFWQVLDGIAQRGTRNLRIIALQKTYQLRS